MKRGKYVVTKKGNARVSKMPGAYHKKLAKGHEVKSAGRFTRGADGSVKTYSHSWSYGKWPAKGDAKKIRERLEN